MVERYLELEETKSDELPRKGAKTKEASPQLNPLTADNEVEDYVYDIYYRKKDTSHEWDLESCNVGIL